MLIAGLCVKILVNNLGCFATQLIKFEHLIYADLFHTMLSGNIFSENIGLKEDMKL